MAGNQSFTLTCKKVLGPKKQHHKEWISNQTPKKIEERKRKKAEINNSRTPAGKAWAYEEYFHATKTAKKSIKADKKKYMNMLATETEEAAHQGNLGELYATIKKLSGMFGKPEIPVKDKGGKPIPDEEGQKKRWMEHFEDLLHRQAPQDPPDIPQTNDDLLYQLERNNTTVHPRQGVQLSATEQDERCSWPQLQDQQSGFRRSRSCTDQVATLRLILEESCGWNSPLYTNFIDYEKPFDSELTEPMETAETLWQTCLPKNTSARTLNSLCLYFQIFDRIFLRMHHQSVKMKQCQTSIFLLFIL